jgi:fibronectin-binding autotransporter adhesin
MKKPARVCSLNILSVLRLKSTLLPLLAGLGFAEAIIPADAQIYWNGVGTNWQATADWSTASGAVTPNPAAVPGASDTAVFNISTVNTAQIGGLNANVSVAGLVFNNTNTTWIRSGGAAQTLIIGNGGIVITNSVAGSPAFGTNNAAVQNVNIVIGGSQAWINNGNGQVRLYGSLAAPSGTPATLTFDGSSSSGFGFLATSNGISDGSSGGTLNLAVTSSNGKNTVQFYPTNSTYSGGTTVKAGIIQARTPLAANTTVSHAFGTGQIVLGDANPNANLVQLALVQGNYTNPIVLEPGTAGQIQIHNVSSSAGQYFIMLSGGITGTNTNLGLAVDSFSPGQMTFAGAPINFVGKLAIGGVVNGGISTSFTYIQSEIGTNVTSVTINANSATSTNQLLLGGTNTYFGPTIIKSSLLLTNTASIASSSNINIGSFVTTYGGGKLDVSGLTSSTFSLSANNTLTAGGSAGVYSRIVGKAGGMVDFGSQPIYLTIAPTSTSGDSIHPALAVQNASLKFGGNTFTITNAGGNPLGAGSYAIITNTSGFAGSVTTNCAVAVYGAGLATGMTGSIQTNGVAVNLVVVTANTPPVAATMTVPANVGVSLKIALADVATNWTDADGDTVVLAGINLITTNGVTLTTNNAYIFYPNVTGNDQINYTVTDGNGGTNTGLINIVANTGSVTGQQATITVSGGTATMNFAGIPGDAYYVQRSTDLSTWTTISTNPAPANGVFQFIDNSPPGTSAFYRLSTTP